MKRVSVSLEDRFQVDIDRVYVTACQALVRLPLLQRRLDAAAGLNTAGFISGYRGSPLGQLDIQLWQARAHLEAEHIRFRPGVNEELAATAVWGTQQLALRPEATFDGVFALWYGKGPGVDRSGDAFKHGNYAGTAPNGGVLLVAGDDHACKSSSLPHQSEPALVAANVPVLSPADVYELLEFGLHGWALSRWSGRYVGMKVAGDVAESSASIAFDVRVFRPSHPESQRPDAGLRAADTPQAQEARVLAVGLPAAQDYVRANRLDRIRVNAPAARLGIVTAGRCYHEARQALADLGFPDGRAPGLRLLKLGLTWPVDPHIVRDFARGLNEIVVIEDKAPLIEGQLKQVLFDLAERPRVLGRRDEAGAPLLRADGEVSAADIALVLADRLGRYADTEALRRRREFLREQADWLARVQAPARRPPYFCSGCPHNTSTKVIEGSRALAGIGCHYMVRWMDRRTESFSQMGGEGVAWIGQAPFTGERHVFANMGDGTYFHSGLLAIRAAVAAGVNITYKLLFNDAVAMTGGQPVDGPLTVPQATRQLAAEGVAAIAVVSDEPEKLAGVTDFAPGVAVHHRRELPVVERAFRDIPGTTAIIYDQTCAAEKRRRRKRGTLPEASRRVFINAEVCEGCGDCSRASNCLSVVPVETEFGTKRRIDQSSCNGDLSCVEGFCPSFITLRGATLARRSIAPPDEADLPTPALPRLDSPWSMLIAGVGGTGIVTIGALLGVAAHAEGRRVSVLDMQGMAQKGGAVASHVRIAADADQLHALRIGQGGADVLLAADVVVAAQPETLATLRRGATTVVLNTHETPTAEFVLHPDTRLPAAQMRRGIVEAAGRERVRMLDATALAAALVGDALAANVLLLGFAWQGGQVPLTRDSLLDAIELNGAAVTASRDAFAWGRRAAVDPEGVAAAAGLAPPATEPMTLDSLIQRRAAHLRDYQGRRLVRRYLRLVGRVREVEERMFSGSTALTETVARNYARLLAYKDEYEVARLYTTATFAAALAEQFENPGRIEFHLASPLFARPDPATGQPRKRRFGPRMVPMLRILARLRWLRGTPFDPFGYCAERRTERWLIGEYEDTIAQVLSALSPRSLATAVALADLPQRIRGFGHVKQRAMQEAAAERLRLLERLVETN